MKVYVIRHGESINNWEKKWTGWQDVPLTATGREDAKKAGEYLRTISFDKVFSSDLSRALETAKIALPQYDCKASPLLREVNVGSLAGRHLSSLTDEERLTVAKEGYGAFGGETKGEFSSRIKKMMEELENRSEDTVALFCHAGFLRSMLDTVVGTVLPRKNILCENCAVAVFEQSGGIWKLHSWLNFSP